jgi:hypothetical protein
MRTRTYGELRLESPTDDAQEPPASQPPTGHRRSAAARHADGERPIGLPDADPPYAAAGDHTLACLTGHAGNLIEPASALPALELTLDVHQRLTQAAS